jgi:hypothetical protein
MAILRCLFCRQDSSFAAASGADLTFAQDTIDQGLRKRCDLAYLNFTAKSAWPPIVTASRSWAYHFSGYAPSNGNVN